MSDRTPPSPAYVFPEEIISHILSHVPIKSLLRFRSVCRLWRSLISPQFVKSQLLFRAISTSTEKVNLFSTKPLTSPIEHPIGNRFVSLECPPIDPEHYVQVLGTCNGFVCLVVSKSNRKYLVIFSPSTGNYKYFPAVPEPTCMEIGMGFPTNDSDLFGGFAFDPSIDDYKVVLIAPQLVDTSPKAVMVLHLRESNSNWRITGLYSDSFFAESNCFLLTGKTPSGPFLNGALHWIGGNRDVTFWRGPVGKMGVIVCFHLAQEVVSKIELPDDIFHPHGLGVLGEYLCVYHSGRTPLEIWTMQEYGVKASWAKLYDIPRDVYNQTPTLRYCYLVPLCFLRSGELLIVVNGNRSRRSGGVRHRRYTEAIGTKLVAYSLGNLGNGMLQSLVSDGHHDMRVAVLDAEDMVPPNGHSESVFLRSDGPESYPELSEGEVYNLWFRRNRNLNPTGRGNLPGTSTATPGPSNV